jgi:uncharacterized Zn-binding protein involved in type VI secretion
MGAAMMFGARRTGSHDATNDGKRGCKQAAQKARPRISGRGRRQHGGQSDGKNQFSFAHDHLARQGQRPLCAQRPRQAGMVIAGHRSRCAANRGKHPDRTQQHD